MEEKLFLESEDSDISLAPTIINSETKRKQQHLSLQPTNDSDIIEKKRTEENSSSESTKDSDTNSLPSTIEDNENDRSLLVPKRRLQKDNDETKKSGVGVSTEGSPSRRRSTSELENTTISSVYDNQYESSDSVTATPTRKKEDIRKRKSLAFDEDDFSLPSSVEEIKQHFEEQPDLYQIIFDLEYSVEHTVNEWIRKYESDCKEAIMVLIQFIVNCCGCKAQDIPIDILNDMEDKNYDYPNKLVRWMKRYYEENSNVEDHPIFRSNRFVREFWSLLNNFWEIFIYKIPEFIICANFFENLIINLLIILSNSQDGNRTYNPVFVKVALTSVLKIATGLLKTHINDIRCKRLVYRILEEAYDNKLHWNVNDIVLICVKEYVEWITLMPSLLRIDLAKGRYEKSVFMDGFIPVRYIAAKGLLNVFKKYENDLKATNSFIKNAEVVAAKLLNDQVDKIVITAIKILQIIRKQKGELDGSHVTSIYYRVYNINPDISYEAAVYLDQVLNDGSEDSKDYIRDLVTFYAESEFSRDMTQLVTTLAKITDKIFDWNAMTDLLIYEYTDDDSNAIIFTKLLATCIMAAVNPEKESMNSDQKKITELFGERIVTLLQQNRSTQDPSITTNLIVIPRYFNMKILTENEQFFESLFDELCLILETEFDEIMLRVASKTLEILKSKSGNKRCSAKIDDLSSKLIDIFIDQYGICKGYAVNNEAHSQHEIEKFLKVTKQLFALYECHNLNNHELMTTILNAIVVMLKHFTEFQDYAERIVVNLITMSTVSFTWSLVDIKKTDLSESVILDMEKNLKKNVNMFIKIVMHILTDEHSYWYMFKIFKATCDVVLWIKHLIVNDNEFAQVLSQFLDTYIFVENIPQVHENSIEKNVFIAKELLRSYCKLVIHNRGVYKVKTIAKHYLKYQHIYGDIIESTLVELSTDNMEITIYELFFVLLKEYEGTLEVNFEEVAEGNLKIAAKHFIRIIKLQPGDSVYLEHLHANIMRDIFYGNQSMNIFKVMMTFEKKLADSSKKKLLEILEKTISTEPAKSFKNDINIINYISFLKNKTILEKPQKSKQTKIKTQKTPLDITIIRSDKSESCDSPQSMDE